MPYQELLAVALLLFQGLIAPPEHALNDNWLGKIVPPHLVELFIPMQFEYSGGRYDNFVFNYRLFQPDQIEHGQKYPILVWASGYGEMTEDNFSQLRHLQFIFQNPDTLEKYPFYCLVMQVPSDRGVWYESVGVKSDDDPSAILMSLLKKIERDYPVDPDRIYLSGVSIGGTACWELTMRYPDRFAAVAPLASGGTGNDMERLHRITHIPIWAFHSTEDRVTSVDHVRRTVRSLDSLSGIVHLTEIPSRYHDCWTAAFEDYKLMDWLLDQRRGNFCWNRPGRVRPDWKYLLLQFGLPALLVAAIVMEWKRRQRSKAAA